MLRCRDSAAATLRRYDTMLLPAPLFSDVFHCRRLLRYSALFSLPLFSTLPPLRRYHDTFDTRFTLPEAANTQACHNAR